MGRGGETKMEQKLGFLGENKKIYKVLCAIFWNYCVNIYRKPLLPKFQLKKKMISRLKTKMMSRLRFGNTSPPLTHSIFHV